MNCPKCNEYFSNDTDLIQHQMMELVADKMEQQQIDDAYVNVQTDAANIIALTRVCLMAGERLTSEEAVDRYYHLIDLILAHDVPPDDTEKKTDVPDVWRTALRDDDDLSKLD